MKQTPLKTRPAPKTESATPPDPFRAGQKDFERLFPRLMRRYPEQFVALLDGQVVDHDPNDEALAARMFANFGDAPFYIAHVTRQPRIYDLPSPEVEI